MGFLDKKFVKTTEKLRSQKENSSNRRQFDENSLSGMYWKVALKIGIENTNRSAISREKLLLHQEYHFSFT